MTKNFAHSPYFHAPQIHAIGSCGAILFRSIDIFPDIFLGMFAQRNTYIHSLSTSLFHYFIFCPMASCIHLCCFFCNMLLLEPLLWEMFSLFYGYNNLLVVVRDSISFFNPRLWTTNTFTVKTQPLSLSHSMSTISPLMLLLLLPLLLLMLLYSSARHTYAVLILAGWVDGWLTTWTICAQAQTSAHTYATINAFKAQRSSIHMK